MKYQILHETAHSLRVRRLGRGFSMPEAESLKAQLAVSGEVRTSRIYPATGGIRLEYTCPRKEILAFLNALEPVSLETAGEAKTGTENTGEAKTEDVKAGKAKTGAAKAKDVKAEKQKAEKPEIKEKAGDVSTGFSWNDLSGGAITASAGGLANVIITPFPLRDMAEEEIKSGAKGHVSREELKTRKMDPNLKKKLRRRIILEAGADLLMPMPVQMAYHLYQLVTLKEF